MPSHHPLRFGAAYFSLEQWTECARKVESLGYAPLLLVITLPWAGQARLSRSGPQRA